MAVVAHAAEKPNSVFIMVDDLGPGWVDFDGSDPTINTPNLERMADAGSGSQAAIQYDNIGVTGDVLAIPEPSTYAMLAGMLAFTFVMLRRRQS